MPKRARTVAGGDREVRARSVPDEQRVAGEGDPFVDDEGAVLGPVPRRVEHPHAGVADRKLIAVGERLERIFGIGEWVDRDRQFVLERKASVTGDVVRMRMGLEHALDPNAVRGCALEVLLDLERGIDDDGHACGGVADQIRGAAQILVHELPEEEHGLRG